MAEKARYWTWIGYPESMIDDWEDRLSEILQYPFAYCLHDKDTTDKEEEKRKPHVHIVVAYGNTTTINTVRKLFSKLRKDHDINKVFVEPVQNIRFIYNYLIHDTENARKQKKHLYDPEERKTGNDFDIGAYVQTSTRDKLTMMTEILTIMKQKNMSDFATLTDYVLENLSLDYFEILQEKSGFFERYIKGNFHRSFYKTNK